MRKPTKYGLMSATLFVAGLLMLLVLFTGCALTEEYWSEQYARMTPQELEDARNNGAEVSDIWIGAQTSSTLVCIDGECVVVQVY